MRSALLILWCCLSPLASAELNISPPLQRVDLQAADVAAVTWTIHAVPGTTVTAVIADCACIRSLTQVPAKIDGSGRLDLHMRVTGMRPGIETILVATSVGILRTQVQIVGPGAGRGVDQLRSALADAQQAGWQILAISHDLSGHVRHCGCSQGALEGAGRLARLPALAADMQPGQLVTWILSGDVDGKLTGLGSLLAERNWKLGDRTVRISADPLALLNTPDIVAIIPTVAVAVEHRRILRPVLTGGMVVELLLIDGKVASIIPAHEAMTAFG